MKKIIALATVLIILATGIGCSTDPVSSTVTATVLSNRLKDTTDKLTASIDRATINSDYLLEKNLMRLELVGHALAGRLEKETGTNREFVSVELEEAMTKFSELVDQAQGGILELEDFFVLDIQRILNQIPFKKDEYLIRRVDGYSVENRINGAYEFRLLGNAFEPGNSYKVTVDGVSVDPSNVYGGASSNTLRFTVPVDLLNNKFSVGKVERISYSLAVSKPNTDKEFFEFESHILLLPTHPVQFKLTETRKDHRWSGENNSKICSRSVGPSGRNGVWTQAEMSCSVSDPAQERFTREKSRRTSGSHSRADAARFNADKTTATSTCHNQCHDCPRTCTWDLGVESKVYYSGDFEIELKPLSLTSLKPVTADGSSFIPYGSYEAKISSEYETFTFSSQYFNGKPIVLHPRKLTEYGIRIAIDSDDSQDAQFKRLIIEVKDAAFQS